MLVRIVLAVLLAFIVPRAILAQVSTPAESSAVQWLGYLENNFPNYPEWREEERARHKLAFPWCYPDTTQGPTPENLLLELDVYVTGDPGAAVRGGLPIPDEQNLEAAVTQARVGGIIGLARTLAVYGDGTARWVQIVLPPETPRGWLRLGLWTGSTPMSAPVKSSAASGGVRADQWTEVYPWPGPSSRWRAWTNTTPTGTMQGGAQPTCRSFGTPEERIANVDGVSIVLRAGERVGKAEVPGRFVWCPTSWYRDAEDEAFLGAVAVLGQAGDRGAFIDLSLEGLVDRVLGDGLKAGLEPLRDLGDVNADHEGPESALRKWRNNEYGIVDGLWRCFAALVGEPGAEPDARAGPTFHAAVSAARHWATVDVYHLEIGPLPWMWGAVWQHEEHGGSGEGDPHRGMSPNTGHWNTNGVPIVGYLAADPMIRDAVDLVQRRTRWKVENGPGMPGIPDVAGAERATANLLRVLNEARLDHPAESTAYRAACDRVLEEGVANRSYVAGDNTGKVKPWMVCLLAEELDRYSRQGSARAGELLVTIREAIAASWIINPNSSGTRVYYQRNPDITDWTGFHNLLAADVLRESHPMLAARLYETGSVDPWYSGDHVKWPKTLTAQGVIDYGHRYARSVR